MEFSIGDHVQVLDDNLIGIVKQISGNTVLIETEDGFTLEFETRELVKDNPKSEIKKMLISTSNIAEVISEKEHVKKRFTKKKKPKDRYLPTMEVDLHIHQLVKSSRGMTNHDMLTLQLDTARRQLDFAIKKRVHSRYRRRCFKTRTRLSFW
jgi:RNA polymerase-interacting CarD/CdnL/TRCF family regulator